MLSPIVIEDNKFGLGESPSMILPKPNNRQSSIVEDIKMYEPLPGCYPKVYMILELVVLFGVISTIVYSYIVCLGYFEDLRRDLLIK